MKAKTFDCVEMKNAIQRKLAEETRGMTDDQRREYHEKLILSDPGLARLWKNAKRVTNAGAGRKGQ